MIEMSLAGDLALDFAVLHDQHCLRRFCSTTVPVLRVVDQVGAFVARIGDEDAAQPAVRQPLADLDEQPVLDLAERAFLDHQRQQVGARGGDEFAAASAGHRDRRRCRWRRMRCWPARESRITGRAMIMGELPAALITTSSESLFMKFSVCATAMIGRERQHDRNDRRQDQRRDLEEGQRRLAAVGHKVDAGQDLRRPHDRQRPDQRREEQQQRAPKI